MTMRQIVVMGGGGFWEESTPLLDQYILSQSQSIRPKICMLPTAQGDSDRYLVKFYEQYTHLDCAPTHLSLFRPHTADIADFLLSQDIIFVGCGNTKSMLALWREWGVDGILKQAWDQGIVLSGVSAGSICWFEQGATDSIPGKILPINAMGFLKGAVCPHYDGQPERARVVPDYVARGDMKPCLAIDNSCAVRFVNDEIVDCVSSIPGRTARMVTADGLQPDMNSRFLGNRT